MLRKFIFCLLFASTLNAIDLDASGYLGVGGFTQSQLDFTISAWQCYFQNNIANLVSLNLYRLHNAGMVYVDPVGNAKTPIRDWAKNFTSAVKGKVSNNLFADWCTTDGMNWLMNSSHNAIQTIVNDAKYTGAASVDLDVECDGSVSSTFLQNWLNWQNELSTQLSAIGVKLQAAVNYWPLDPATKMAPFYYRLLTMSTYVGNNYTKFVSEAQNFQTTLGSAEKSKAGFCVDVCMYSSGNGCTTDQSILNNIADWMTGQAPSGLWVWGQNTLWNQTQQFFYRMLNNKQTLPTDKYCPGKLSGYYPFGDILRQQRPYRFYPPLN